MNAGLHPARILCPECGTVNRVPPDRSAAEAKCGACHRPLFDHHPREVDEAGFERHLRWNDIPVVLDVWAPWCGPCRIMAPHFERAAAILEPDVRLLKLNADTAPKLSAQYGVRSIPSTLLFDQGVIVARTAGAMNTEAIVQWVRASMPKTPAPVEPRAEA